MISFISSLETISVVKPGTKIFLWIAASFADAAVVKTVLKAFYLMVADVSNAAAKCCWCWPCCLMLPMLLLSVAVADADAVEWY